MKHPHIFCDIHLKPMEEIAKVIGTADFGRQPLEEDFRHCSEPGCDIYFNRDHGYVKIIGSQILGSSRQSWCPTHKEPRAIVGIHAIGADPQPRLTRQCLHPECSEAQTVAGDVIHRGDLVRGPGGRFLVLAIEGQWATLEMVGLTQEGELKSVGYWDRVLLDELAATSLPLAGRAAE